MIQKTVYYIGHYEKEIRDNHIYHRIQIGDVAIVEQVDDNAESIHYTLRDHLGSLIATVSDTGTIKRLFYDPWGKRLNLPVLEAQPITLFDLASFLTPRGFTGHEHLDNVGLIHMNGRVYDPEIARFVSADPILSAPTYLQSYNRYSYVWNNPLRFTDPNGFEPASMRGTGLDGHGVHKNYSQKDRKWNYDKDHSKANKQYAQKQALELKREIQRIAQVKADRAEAKRIEAAKFAEIARIAQARKDAALAKQKEADERAAAQQALDYTLRLGQVVGGIGQIVFGMSMFSGGLTGIVGVALIAKGIDNIQSAVRGTSSLSQDLLIKATGSKKAGAFANAALDMGT